MRKPSREYVFKEVYETAALVEACIDNDLSLIELDWDDRDIMNGLVKFSKISILHRYIYAMIAVERRREYRKNADLYESGEIEYLERLFDTYEIEYEPYSTFRSPIPPEKSTSRVEDPFYQWFLSQEESFELLWEKLTDETFHILFGNRAFLLKFNVAISRYLKDEKIAIPSDYRSNGGKIKRQPIPIWVRDAVIYRDHGRCVLCQVDLSGLLATDRSDHLDHMVPLEKWGINDPCNIQLLCEGCNLKKAGGEPITGNRYSSWWS